MLTIPTTRDQNLETRDESTTLRVIRAALQLAANAVFNNTTKQKRVDRNKLAIATLITGFFPDFF